ncbi:MAG: T9SS C-terminal target domain-containing protein [Calditrichaeota bacterium]|nr:MAG: T9SS C-terminal target domain-containing protein [Calditrichota bacterium]
MMKRLPVLLAALLLISLWGVVRAQNYVGSTTCMTCHNTVNPTLGYNIWEEYMKTGHPYKLNRVQGGPPVYPDSTSPGVPSPPPANPNWNDYWWVIGGYGWKARFVQAADGKIFTADSLAQYNLFPRGTPQWVPYHYGEDKPYNYNCFKCHTTGPDPSGSWHPTTPDLGTFVEPGIRCEGCHGPGSAHVADPMNVAPPIQADSLTFLRCGDCHSRGGKTNAIPASGGFIRHHEQFNEMKASEHGDGVGTDLTCGTCHDTHIALLYPQAAGAGLSAIRTDCAVCHPNHEIYFTNGQPHPAECTDCHMPKASKSAVGTQEGNGWLGDVATHIWHINTDPVPRDSMFTSDGHVKLDADGHAAVTLDFVCLVCHQNQTVNWASPLADEIHQHALPMGVGDLAALPVRYELRQNYPNPFNPATTIEYVLPRSTRVRLTVYNLLGQPVAVLVNGVQGPGTHTVRFEGRDLPSGVYVYRLETRQETLSRKMVLLR